MIGHLWRWHRRSVIATAVACCVVLVAAMAVVALHPGSSGKPGTVSRRGTDAPATILAAPPPSGGHSGSGYHPRYVVPPATARQNQLASALASAENPQQVAAVEALPVPAGSYSTAFPAVPATATDDELTYAQSWVTELLDIDYRSQSRSGLLAWAVEGEAANTLPGVPAGVGDKALYASLADPTLGGQAGTSPVPSAGRWTANTNAGVIQRASRIETSVDPEWTTLVSEGFVPIDPLMALVDITGTLTTSASGQPVSRVGFKVVLTVGSALHHPGYGAVTLDGWTVT